ncbi:MAG: hypothetical protein ABI702_07130 [Burkholderiales bacterium]
MGNPQDLDEGHIGGLDAVAQIAHDRGLSPQPRSGHQERLENIVNRFA